MEKKVKIKSVSTIKKSLKKVSKESYERGVRDAMSTAVNLFNCEERIRQLVFKAMKIKSEKLYSGPKK